MKKGEIVSNFITAANFREVTTCIGFIIAFKYGKDFGSTEVTLLYDGKWTDAFTHATIYNTVERANSRMKVLQKDNKEILYVRPYMSSKYTKVEI